MLSARLEQLSPLAREVANVAAVIGRAFTFTTLAQASSESEDAVVRGLDELWQRRIVQEQHAEVTETYDFSHDKLRTHVVYLAQSRPPSFTTSSCRRGTCAQQCRQP